MRIKKIIPILSISALGFTPFAFSSCSCSDPKWYEIDSTGYADFIADRTFSIMCENNKNYVYGTGWILADATPTVYNDYSYYIATNWHVIVGFEELPGTKTYKFADKSCQSGSAIPSRNYTEFKSFNLAKASQFMYVDSSYFKEVIDFYVAKVDFNNGMNSSIKAKLDRLNKTQEEEGHINTFADSIEDFKTGNKYVGGYPYSDRYGGTQWEVHGIKSSAFEYSEIDPHTIGDNAPYSYYYDCSPQISFTKDAPSFMSGGASGSMIINSDYKICGVYWGGWSNKKTGDYFPTFSYIKDFVRDSYELE